MKKSDLIDHSIGVIFQVFQFSQKETFRSGLRSAAGDLLIELSNMPKKYRFYFKISVLEFVYNFNVSVL